MTIACDWDSGLMEDWGNGYPQGFECDLVYALCDQMGISSWFLGSSSQADQFKAVAKEGTADVAISSIIKDDDVASEEGVEFTTGYLPVTVALYALDTKGFTSKEDLATLVVGVKEGTYAAKWAEENMTHASLAYFKSSAAMFAALREGFIDGVVGDLSLNYIHAGYIDDYSDYGLDVRFGDTNVVLVERYETEYEYAIAVRDNNSTLLRALNLALSNIKENGTYDELYSTYFGGIQSTAEAKAAEAQSFEDVAADEGNYVEMPEDEGEE